MNDGVGRKDLAEDRNALANQRTYAAWLRTALAATAVAVAFERLFNELQPAWLAKTGASILLVTSALMLVIAIRSYRAVAEKLDLHTVSRQPRRSAWLLTGLSFVANVVAAVAIWVI